MASMEPLFPIEPGTLDGYVTCERGHEHWGRGGAAGLLLTSGRGEERLYLLQHRSPEVHEGDCWGIPGGALGPDESPAEGALRETEEEMGPISGSVTIIAMSVEDHGGWAYSSVIAEVPEPFEVTATNWETGDEGYRWVTLAQALELPLHRGVARLLTQEFASLALV